MTWAKSGDNIITYKQKVADKRSADNCSGFLGGYGRKKEGTSWTLVAAAIYPVEVGTASMCAVQRTGIPKIKNGGISWLNDMKLWKKL